MFGSYENTREMLTYQEKKERSGLVVDDEEEGRESDALSILIDLEEEEEWDETLYQHIDAATDLLLSDNQDKDEVISHKEKEKIKTTRFSMKKTQKKSPLREDESALEKEEVQKNRKSTGKRELRKRSRNEDQGKSEAEGRKTRRRN